MSPEAHLRLHELRRYRLGELDGAPLEGSRRHLESCAQCRARLEAMEEDERAFAASTDFARSSAEILARFETAKEKKRPGWLGLPVLLRVATASALVLALVLPLTGLFEPKGPGLRTKGEASPILEMFVRDASGIRRGQDGMTLHAGDSIQFRYRAAGYGYLMIVSVESNGAVSPLYPDAEDQSVPVRPDGEHLLEGSIVLDDAKGRERILAFFSAAPLESSAVAQSIRERVGGGMDLSRSAEGTAWDGEVEQITLSYVKE